MLDVGLIVVVILAALVSYMIIRRGADQRGQPMEYAELPDVELGLELQEDLRSLAAQGHTEEAIKVLRKRTKLTPHQATLVIQALMVGRTFAAPEIPQQRSDSTPAALVDDDLLRRLNALVAQDPLKRTAALQLLRDRTGMSARDARRFINAL